jgi:hypothetical protein
MCVNHSFKLEFFISNHFCLSKIHFPPGSDILVNPCCQPFLHDASFADFPQNIHRGSRYTAKIIRPHIEKVIDSPII